MMMCESSTPKTIQIDGDAVQYGLLGTQSFFMKTSDVAALSSMMYAMSGLTKALRVYVSKEGMSISEGVSRDNMFLFAKFLSSQFEEFTCEGDCVICFDPGHLYQCIRGHQQRDVLHLEFNKKKPRKLIVGITRYGGDSQLEYEIDLFGCIREVYTAPPEEVDYFLAFDVGVIVNIISELYELRKDFPDNWVTIDCGTRSVVFSKMNGCMITKVRIERKTAETPDDDESTEKKRRRKNKSEGDALMVESDCIRKGEQKHVCHEYYIMDLHRLQKCFAINRGYIVMYIKENFPLVFEIKVGTLGRLRAVLMYRQDGFEEDKE